MINTSEQLEQLNASLERAFHTARPFCVEVPEPVDHSGIWWVDRELAEDITSYTDLSDEDRYVFAGRAAVRRFALLESARGLEVPTHMIAQQERRNTSGARSLGARVLGIRFPDTTVAESVMLDAARYVSGR